MGGGVRVRRCNKILVLLQRLPPMRITYLRNAGETEDLHCRIVLVIEMKEGTMDREEALTMVEIIVVFQIEIAVMMASMITDGVDKMIAAASKTTNLVNVGVLMIFLNQRNAQSTIIC